MDVVLTYWWVPLVWATGALLLWYATWVLYLANMATRSPQAQSRMAPSTRRLVAAVVFLAELGSTLLNWFVFTVLLVELPRERFLSTRLMRHYRQGNGWRSRFAGWVGRVWLDPFDPAGHHI